MGWFIFLLIVAGIIVIVVVRKKKRKNEHLGKFYGSVAYHIAEQIKDELIKNGYSAGIYSPDPGKWHLWNYNSDYGFAGSLAFYDGNKKLIGSVGVDFNPRQIFTPSEFHRKNASALNGQFYVIQNDLIGLIVESDEESKEIPPIIEIAARIIKNSEYQFKHPDWWFERYPDAQKYLNVMFQ